MKTSDVIIGEGDWRMAWNAEVGGWKKAALSLTSGLITVWTRRSWRLDGGYVMPPPLIPCSLGRCIYFSPPLPPPPLVHTHFVYCS